MGRTSSTGRRRKTPPISFDLIRPYIHAEGVPKKDVDLVVSLVVHRVRKILNKNPGEP